MSDDKKNKADNGFTVEVVNPPEKKEIISRLHELSSFLSKNWK